VAFALSSGGLAGLELDARQKEELWLTAAQSLFATAVLTSLTFSGREALLLFGLFAVQFAFPSSEVRSVVTLAYLAGAVVIALRNMRDFPALWRGARVAAGAGGRGSAADAH
jgi:cation:H+ antiporter